MRKLMKYRVVTKVHGQDGVIIDDMKDWTQWSLVKTVFSISDRSNSKDEGPETKIRQKYLRKRKKSVSLPENEQ